MSNKMKLGFNFIELGMNKIKPILNFDMAVPCRQFAATSRVLRCRRTPKTVMPSEQRLLVKRKQFLVLALALSASARAFHRLLDAARRLGDVLLGRS